MTTRRTLARSAALAGAVALLVGPLAAGADAAAKKKTPTPTITAQPPAVTASRSASFSFTDSAAGAAFACSLDSAAYTACTSPKTYAGPLTAAAHVFRVRATAPGQVQSNAASASWTIDATPPPAPSLTGVPASPTNDTTASIGFTDTEAGVTFTCSVDGAATAPCTAPLSLSDLGEGSHSVAVAAVDPVGNTSAATTGAWTVDVTPPPVPAITTGPADVTNATTATFDVSDTDPAATLTCSLDAGAFAACGPSATYTSLDPGAHTFDVTATDAAGNTASATQFTWTVDLTAPTPPSILTGPDAVTKDTVATFTFGLPADAASLRCQVDGGAYADCDTPFQTDALEDGPHTLHVLARDEAQNESGATPYSWTVDTTPPPAPSVSGPDAVATTRTAAFTITDTDPDATFTCALDGAAAAPCENGKTYFTLADGEHTLVVTAVDAVGNEAATEFTWTIDATRPTVTFATPVTLGTPVVATFSEPVSEVSTASLVLRVIGSTTSLPSTVTCADAESAAVSCATGPVTTAKVKSTASLIPGQHYSVIANPASAETIEDGAGNVLNAAAGAFRALTTLQEAATGTSSLWRGVSTASAYGGAYRTEHLAGAALRYNFTGTAITWYAVTGPNQGTADVYVDGVKKATVDNWSGSTTYKVPRPLTGLTDAKHQLKIVVTGVKGSAAGTGTYVSVDAVKVGGGSVVTSPTLVNKWRVAGATGPSGGALALADLDGASTSMTFRGTSVDWWTSTGRNRGIAKLYVDGVLKGTYDLYAASTTYNVKRSVTGLTDAVHTVKVVVTGTHRAGATGSLVCLDRWTIG